MVNNHRKIQRGIPPDPWPEAPLARRIVGPIYDLEVVQSIATNPDRMIFATDSADHDAANLNIDMDDVSEIFSQLVANDYHCSEWCKSSARSKIDADVYLIPYDRFEGKRKAFWPQIYLKFGFINQVIRIQILSCHYERGN